MSETRNPVPSKVSDTSQEAELGLFVQDPAGSESTPGFAADSDVQVGQPICVLVRHSSAADVAYDAAGAIVEAFGTKPTLTQGPYRIVKVEAIVHELRTGGTPDHDVKVQMGDGAASEAFTDVAANADLDSGFTVGTAVAIPVTISAATLWSTGRTLRTQLAVSGTTTTGTATVDLLLTLIPAKA